jgi:hypothetical protein
VSTNYFFLSQRSIERKAAVAHESSWLARDRWGGTLPGVVSLEDFDRYVEEHGIPEKHYPAAFALWIAEVTGGPVPRFEKVEREAPADGVVIEGDDL